MLTTLRHGFTPHITETQVRHSYSRHMCGLCHALGDDYGILARLMTSHELILLNLLTSAQLPIESNVIQRRCPLNPLLKVTTNQDVSSKFAAAVAIALANIKLTDDVQDSGGRDVAGRLGQQLMLKPHRSALQELAGLEFDIEILTHLSEQQTQAEESDDDNPSEPSARVSAALFAATARLAGMPENIEPLTAIGYNFGTYIYLMDAYRDFVRDIPRGEYNPLRRFSTQSAQTITLSQAGLVWLLSRFEMIQTSIHENMPKIQLYRHTDLLAALLCDPIDKIVIDLSQQIRQPELTFRRWQWMDVFKAGLFMLPATAFGTLSSDCRSSSDTNRGSGSDTVSGNESSQSLGDLGWCDSSDIFNCLCSSDPSACLGCF